MKEESQAREELLKGRQTFSARDRINCIAESSSIAGIASYAGLLVCLQLARGAGADQATQLKGARRKK
jgi:hypothetical protein